MIDHFNTLRNFFVALILVFLVVQPAAAGRVFLRGDDAGIEVGGMPEEVRTVAKTAELCLHYAGERGSSNKRRERYLERAITKHHCGRIKEKTRTMTIRYSNDYKIINILLLIDYYSKDIFT